METIQVLAGILFLVAGGWLALRMRKWFADFTMKRRFAKGAKAEEDAVVLLERHGYSILDGQASGENVFLVDGEETRSAVRADYIAEKGGQRFVVEVKSGDTAPSPKHSATRRQLLEYEHVFRPDGLILADMTAGVLKRVEFCLKGERLPMTRAPMQWKYLLWSLIAGILLGLVL